MPLLFSKYSCSFFPSVIHYSPPCTFALHSKCRVSPSDVCFSFRNPRGQRLLSINTHTQPGRVRRRALIIQCVSKHVVLFNRFEHVLKKNGVRESGMEKETSLGYFGMDWWRIMRWCVCRNGGRSERTCVRVRVCVGSGLKRRGQNRCLKRLCSTGTPINTHTHTLGVWLLCLQNPTELKEQSCKRCSRTGRVQGGVSDVAWRLYGSGSLSSLTSYIWLF